MNRATVQTGPTKKWAKETPKLCKITPHRPGSSSVRVFIVHSHHEPKSFNGAMTREAVAALIAAGHEVKVSDLYAMGFDPVSDRRNFTSVADPAHLKQQAEEAHATAHNGFAP